jgi:signal transduction histidine kinase
VYKRQLQGEEVPDLMEQKLILNNGEIIDVEIETVTFSREENLYIITVVRDITERKNMQKLKEDNIKKELELQQSKEYDEMKTQFFSNVSHDLKTPLNILLGGLQILKQIHKGSESCPNYIKTSKYAGMMKQNCYRLLRLINNLIDITRADTQFLKMNLINLNIIHLVEKIVESISGYAESKDILIIFDTDVEEKIMAVDPDMIERIMLNLLSNSLKFTGAGGTIEVTMVSQKEGIQLSIKDTGLGIPKDKLEVIFERYKQVNSLMHKENEGTGLGLALVKTFVEAHDGKITINSEIGKGAEFVIILPSKLLDKAINSDDEIATTREVNIERINIEFSDIYS